MSNIQKLQMTIVDADLVEMVEKLLEDVKSGRVIAVAHARINADLDVATAWHVAAQKAKWPLGAAVAMLNHRMAGALLHPENDT